MAWNETPRLQWRKFPPLQDAFLGDQRTKSYANQPETYIHWPLITPLVPRADPKLLLLATLPVTGQH